MTYVFAVTDLRGQLLCRMDDDLRTCCDRHKMLACVTWIMTYILSVTDIKDWPVCHIDNELCACCGRCKRLACVLYG